MEKGIKNIIFDLGGVLIDLDTDRCLREFKALGVSNVEELVNSTHTAGVFSALEHGKVSPAEFRDELRRLAGNPELTDAQIDNAWLSILLEIPQKKLDLLLRLNRKYRVFLLSNTNEIHFDWIRRTQFEKDGHRLSDYFEQCFLSHKMGLAKPEDEIFEEVINEAQIFARETLYIDDSEKNLNASLNWCFNTYCAAPGEDLAPLFENLVNE